ncbi:MAG: hypothetical protein JWM03_391 [Rhodocyclales bacterium]|nr:hypothetical protein [Rhodocyclales bacterium]MDB5887519.1 hypothetical protein [Rhodocyclales bacterium]
MKYDLQPEVLEKAESVMRAHGVEDFGAFVRLSVDGLLIDGELSLPELRCLLDMAEQVLAPNRPSSLPGHGSA